MAQKEYLGTFTVDQEFTNKFAKLSGDSNPLHMDPVAARRYQYGTTVVHGICSTFKAIELLLATAPHKMSLSDIKIQFNRPIRHDDVVEVCRSFNEQIHRIELLTNGKRSQVISLTLEEEQPSKSSPNTSNTATNTTTLNHYSFAQAAEAIGSVKLNWDQNLATELFPNAIEKLPLNQIEALLNTTLIVGMKCPGMNSIFGGLNLSFHKTQTNSLPTLNYQVTSSDERFNQLVIGVNNTTCDGEIEAFYRAPPIDQPAFTDIKPLLSGSEFKNQRALVIGGSRGLGEITAKLLAAGGANTVITYASGKEDAERVAREINENNGTCLPTHYDVLAPNSDIITCFNKQQITHIYYLASPIIAKSEQPLWDHKLFSKFCSYYLTGLSNLLTTYVEDTRHKESPLTVFTPSTIFLSKPIKGFGEYCAAKAAAEIFTQNMAKSHPRWIFQTPRLPRMMTDQTSGVVTTNPMETVKVMLQEILPLPLS